MKWIRSLLAVGAIVCSIPVGAQGIGWTLKPEYEAISSFEEGIAAAGKKGKWGYVSAQGEEILPPAYEAAYPFSEGMGVLASNEKQLVAIVDQAGKVTPIQEKLFIDSRFAAFSDGLLLVAKEITKGARKWGYLDKSGSLAIDCKYDIAQPFSEGMAAAVLNSRQCYCWYYMDVTGKALIHLADLRKDVYWALGFYEGKALVLHSKGALFIDAQGRELKAAPPRMTPPEAAASYALETLSCKEGLLAFDAKCRATSFISNDGRETVFIPAPPPPAKPDYSITINGAAAGNVRWISSSQAVVVAGGPKYGMVARYGAPVVAFSLSADTAPSVFGKPAALSLIARNTSPKTLEEVEIKAGGTTFTAPSIAPGGSASFALSFEKETEMAVETKELLLTASEEGLLIGSSKMAVALKDVPSLSISLPASKITLQPGQSMYALKVQVANLSTTQAGAITVAVDGRQGQPIAQLGGGETGTVQFNFPSPKETSMRTLTLSAKPEGAPPVTATVRVSVEVPLPPAPF